MTNSNLIPTSERSKEEARELGRAGGINSGIARREKRTLRQIAEMLLEKGMPVTMPDGTKEDATMSVALVLRQMQKAIKDGDTRAAQYITNLVGEETFAPQNNTTIVVRDEAERKELEDVVTCGR